MSDTIHFTFDHLQLSVTPTEFERVHHESEPVAGTFKVENVASLPFSHDDIFGTAGNFTVVNRHDVSVNVTDVFGIGTNFTFDLHGSAASRFIHHLDHAFHHHG